MREMTYLLDELKHVHKIYDMNMHIDMGQTNMKAKPMSAHVLVCK